MNQNQIKQIKLNEIKILKVVVYQGFLEFEESQIVSTFIAVLVEIKMKYYTCSNSLKFLMHNI